MPVMAGRRLPASIDDGDAVKPASGDCGSSFYVRTGGSATGTDEFAWTGEQHQHGRIREHRPERRLALGRSPSALEDYCAVLPRH